MKELLTEPAFFCLIVMVIGYLGYCIGQGEGLW